MLTRISQILKNCFSRVRSVLIPVNMFDVKPVRHIERNGYHAVDWPERPEFFLTNLWQRFPELVVGNYLVNTSFDSGYLTLSDAERERGWHMVSTLAHSPKIQTIDQIPHDTYDEWLIFDRPTQVEEFETMVNYLDFSPVEFDWKEKQERFWNQVIQLQPSHVIGENDAVYLVSRDKELVKRILETEKARS